MLDKLVAKDRRGCLQGLGATVTGCPSMTARKKGSKQASQRKIAGSCGPTATPSSPPTVMFTLNDVRFVGGKWVPSFKRERSPESAASALALEGLLGRITKRSGRTLPELLCIPKVLEPGPLEGEVECIEVSFATEQHISLEGEWAFNFRRKDNTTRGNRGAGYFAVSPSPGSGFHQMWPPSTQARSMGPTSTIIKWAQEVGLERKPTKVRKVVIYLHRWLALASCTKSEWCKYGKASVVRHLCGNPRCIRPMHLRLGSILENSMDWAHHNDPNFGVGNLREKIIFEQPKARRAPKRVCKRT